MTLNLFDVVDDDRIARSAATWTPEAPPSLESTPEIGVDFETSGLAWFEHDRPVGAAAWIPRGPTPIRDAARRGDSIDPARLVEEVARDCRYYPWGHRSGGNLDESQTRRWLDSIRGKRIVNLATKFDAHMARAYGVDWDARGNTLHDVAHDAALLDDRRTSFDLHDLAETYLGIGKLNAAIIDKSRIADYPAGEVATYAVRDVALAVALDAIFESKIRAEGLLDVRNLEDAVIPAVVEMEANGCLIDVDLLQTWRVEANRERVLAIYRIGKETGLSINPESSRDMTRLFTFLGLTPAPNVTETGAPSYTDAILERFDHPVIVAARKARALGSVLSKFLDKYAKTIGSDGILRYALHQLRVDGETGTISGRFSSSAFRIPGRPPVGANVQQVAKPSKQRKKLGDSSYTIRRLFKPGAGRWLKADAEQIQYRLFAHYAEPPRMIAAYHANPRVNYHTIVQGWLEPVVPTLGYDQTKNTNFAKLFGAGPSKIAEMTGMSEVDARSFLDVYDREFPEARDFITRASRTARDRGYVRSILGRRFRFPDGRRLYAALNRVIQGSEADLVKLKLVAIHENRKALGLVPRITNHDEWGGDLLDESLLPRVRECFDEQVLPTKVPILWDVAVGDTWATE